MHSKVQRESAPAAIGRILSIHQPYAELIVQGRKLVENRTWKTPFRGILWIHAGKTDTRLSRNAFLTYPEMKLGGIVGAVRLVDCLDFGSVAGMYPFLKDHRHLEGPECWILRDAVRVPFMELRGLQGIWHDQNVFDCCSQFLPEHWLKP